MNQLWQFPAKHFHVSSHKMNKRNPTTEKKTYSLTCLSLWLVYETRATCSNQSELRHHPVGQTDANRDFSRACHCYMFPVLPHFSYLKDRTLSFPKTKPNKQNRYFVILVIIFTISYSKVDPYLLTEFLDWHGFPWNFSFYPFCRGGTIPSDNPTTLKILPPSNY